MSRNSRTQVWLDNVRRGDELAASKILASYHPMLRARVDARMDQTLKGRLEPEDILQQAYIEVFRQLGSFEDRGAGSFLNWVLTILDHKLVDAGRALRRQVRDVAREVPGPAARGTESYWNLLDQLYADSTTPSQLIRREEAVSGLMACLSGLSDSHRQVIQLRFLEGRSVGEIATRLGKSDAAIVALTKRALEGLRKAMERLGDFTRS